MLARNLVGTRPVADAHRFDVAALERYLATRIEGFCGPIAAEQFSGGQSNPTYQALEPAVGRMCCAANRRASCCRRRTRSIANIA